MIKKLSLAEFLENAKTTLVVDVRTPLEFAQSHIPGAVNIPIFSNEERVIVGTAYKQQGRQPAILLGFEITGPKWANFIRQAEVLAPDKNILVHCWRGGMRSGAMAWAFNLYGFNVATLEGGYKAFRRFGLDAFEKNYPFTVLSGNTGSAKTKILEELKTLGEQVVNLEDLAQHQGSSFGSMNKLTQPSQEQFENLLGLELQKLNLQKRIWIEDESVTIGKRVIPKNIWKQLRSAPVVKVEMPKSERIEFLNNDYGSLDKEFLKEAVQRISKRLGPLETKLTLQAIDENRMRDFINQVLIYYDKTYSRGLGIRDKSTIHPIIFEHINPKQNAKDILAFAEQTIKL
jgi:tRNA 2-selenouridine synthase|nr:tRNA 2-selenouridine(34) synthase MnmH [uncultured Pedobacter sp.]